MVTVQKKENDEMPVDRAGVIDISINVSFRYIIMFKFNIATMQMFNILGKLFLYIKCKGEQNEVVTLITTIEIEH